MYEPNLSHPQLVNIYGCEFGKDVFVGPFVEIQKRTIIGDYTRIQSHSFICEGVTIGYDCFIGHGVMFINDTFDGKSHHSEDWIMKYTKVGNRVRIGSNATILPVNIGNDVVIGAGAVVTKDVLPGSIVKGNPAK